MPKNTFISLVHAIGAGIFFGILADLATALLFCDSYHYSSDDFFPDHSINMIVALVLSLVMPFVFSIGFLLPLAAIEKNRIEQRHFKELLIRYSPLLTLPAGLITLILFTCSNYSGNDYYIFLTLMLTVYSVCCASLWFFIKRLKA